MVDTVESEPISIAKLAAPGIAAVRRFWRPFLFLQACALLLVISYFKIGPVRAACETLATWRESLGLLFVAVASAIAGGLLPELAKAIVPPKTPPLKADHAQRSAYWREVAFTTLLFAVNGIITDLQYRVFARVIGSGNHPSIVIRKTLVDQFITTPIYGIPYFPLMYAWRSHGFRILPVIGELSRRWYLLRVIPLLIPCWCFWIPMVSLIYSLPGPLQFCLFSLALGAWSLILVFAARREM